MGVVKYRNLLFLLFSLLAFFFGVILKGKIYDPAVLSISVFFMLLPFILIFSSSRFLRAPQFILKLVIVSFVIKLIGVFVVERALISTLGIPFIGYGDDYAYNVASSDILEAWKTTGIGFYDDIRFGSGFYSGYPIISAAFKQLFGDHYLVPRLMNVLFSSLTVIFFYRTVKIITTEYLSKVITVLFAFSTTFLIYSALQLKETVLLFFLSVLIYGVVSLLDQGITMRRLIMILLSAVFLIFFRAAILLAFIFALLGSYFLTKRQHRTSNRLLSIISVVFVIIAFVFLWEYLYSLNILGLDAEHYFDSRLSTRTETGSDMYSGTNDLSRLGIIGVILGPLLTVFSLFLPTPVFVNLDEHIKSFNYHYLPSIEYYAILPMAIIGVLYVFKTFRLQRLGVFLLIFLMLYKLGQATTKSIFDTRQSLPAIYTVYLFLGYFKLSNITIFKLWRMYRYIIIFVMIAVMFMFTYGRLSIRY